MAYVKKAFARLTGWAPRSSSSAAAARAGCLTDSRRRGFKQLVEFGQRIAPEAGPGITVAVEPLRRQETNIINSAAKGSSWSRRSAIPNFQLMIDFYHLASEQEDPAIVLEAASTSAICTWPIRRAASFRSGGTNSTTRRSSRTSGRSATTGRISIEASTKDSRRGAAGHRAAAPGVHRQARPGGVRPPWRRWRAVMRARRSDEMPEIAIPRPSVDERRSATWGPLLSIAAAAAGEQFDGCRTWPAGLGRARCLVQVLEH